MREIAFFVEDYAHRQVIGALVRRVAEECHTAIRLDWRNAVGGHGKVIAELDDYMRDLKRQGSPWPDLIVVATDANCKGLNERMREIGGRDEPAPMILPFPIRISSVGCCSTARPSRLCSVRAATRLIRNATEVAINSG